MRADSGRAVMRAKSPRAYARRLLARMHSWPPARKSRARCKLQTHQPQLTEYDCDESLEHKVSYTHARRFRTRCHARKVTARIYIYMRVDCCCACILGSPRANHGRAASYKPTNHNLQSMTVKILFQSTWEQCNTKYLMLMRADSGRAVMRARSRRASARRLIARMHAWPCARKYV